MAKKRTVSKARLGSRERQVLSVLFRFAVATTGAVALATMFSVLPKLPLTFDLFRKQLRADSERKRLLLPAELRRLFEKMRRERLVDLIETKAGLRVVLRREGVTTAIINNLDRLSFERPAQWDGRWRVVIFDIPEKKRKARDALAVKLKELNFYPLQKSTFVFPYPPHDLVDFLTEVFQISPYVRLIEATKIDGEEELLAHFELSRRC